MDNIQVIVKRGNVIPQKVSDKIFQLFFTTKPMVQDWTLIFIKLWYCKSTWRRITCRNQRRWRLRVYNPITNYIKNYMKKNFSVCFLLVAIVCISQTFPKKYVDSLTAVALSKTSTHPLKLNRDSALQRLWQTTSPKERIAMFFDILTSSD